MAPGLFQLSAPKDTLGHCGYWMELYHWIGVVRDGRFLPGDGLAGVLHEQDSVVWLLPRGDTSSHVLFDFTIQVGDSLGVSLRQDWPSMTGVGRTVREYHYVLRLMGRQHDEERGEVVLAYRLEGFLQEHLGGELELLVGWDSGVLGMRVGDPLPGGEMMVIGKRGMEW